MHRKLNFALALALAAFGTAGNAFGDDDNNNLGLQAKPSVFVGSAGGCSPNRPGSNITSAWLTGLGLSG